MTIHLKPVGRGNWKVLIMVLDGDRALPLLFRVGEVMDLAGVSFRICKVTS